MIDVDRLAWALHEAGECRLWPPGGIPLTHREAVMRTDEHQARHYVTAFAAAAYYAHPTDAPDRRAADALDEALG